MDEYGYVSIGVWNIHLDIPLDYIVISFFYSDYLQVVLYYLDIYCYAGMDWSLDQIDNL